jgi:carbamoyltransferase
MLDGHTCMDILGISFGLDTSACLLRDGRVVAASMEERWSRTKHDRNWPAQAITFCLRQAGIRWEELTDVAFFWNPALQLDAPNPGRLTRYRHHGDYLHMVPNWLLPALRPPGAPLRSEGMSQRIELDHRPPLTIHYVPHHRAHAASAFYPSPFGEADCLTVDGYGERASTTFGRWERKDAAHRWVPLGEIDFPQSLGAVYAAVTGWLGFRPNSGEGKVMGLAPYGGPSLLERFRGIVRAHSAGDLPYDIDLSWFTLPLERPDRVSARFLREFGPAKPPGSPPDAQAMDVAWALQAVTEEALLACARWIHRRTGGENLVLAGGVAMNSVANGRLEREGPHRALWVQPAAGDGGTAVGAALWVWHQVQGGLGRHPWLHDRFGPSHDAAACRAALRRGGWRWDEPPDLVSDTALALANGELVGWFQGGSELGARALGARSILADPRHAATKDVLNARVKYREPFRPFAPSVLAERAAEIFDLKGPVPFMQQVHPVRPEWREKLGAVTHVDGSARLHTVTPEADALYHRLIEEFGRRTGVPVLLDTSFNVRGEPMVESPDDAVRCWASTGLDRLVLGPCVLRKHTLGSHG